MVIDDSQGATAMKLRIMLADDHQIFRDALRSFLEKNRDLEVVAEAGNGLEVISLAREHSPDIVCMDIGMPGMNGVETTRRLVAACPGIKVIALSAFFDQHFVLDMMRAGALAYVTKAETGDELLRAITAKSQLFLPQYRKRDGKCGIGSLVWRWRPRQAVCATRRQGAAGVANGGGRMHFGADCRTIAHCRFNSRGA
jgi:CheY-like chemotaxis protein